MSNRDDEGTTLPEMLAVILLLSLVVGLSASNINRRGDCSALSRTSSELESLLKNARLRAVTEKNRQEVIFVEENRRIQSVPSDREVKIPDEIELSFSTLNTKIRPSTNSKLVFFEGGQSSGLTLHIKCNDVSTELAVSRLLGDVIRNEH